MKQQLWWNVARSSGFVSWGLLTAATAWGLVLSTKLLGRRVPPKGLLELHRFLGAFSVIFVAVHMGALVADSYTSFGLADLLVPFASSWRPGPVAWGIVAFWLLVAVELTSLLRARLGPKLWRAIHQASFPLYLLVAAHVLTAGTDAQNPVVVWATILTLGLATFLVLVRLLVAMSTQPARSPRRTPPTPAPVPSARP